MRTCDKEPIISVGLLSAPRIESRVLPDGTFEIDDVTIGIGFHWERRERQRFAGRLRIVSDGDMQVAVNDIPLEEYLKSVISSEMNAAASEALLKAHAVISRSWLLANIRKEADGRPDETREAAVKASDEGADGGVEERIRWYDREDHRLFDVCADDHCQRYQGLARQNAAAAGAVAGTRGEVLTFGGAICDTRFSKCCGGRSERFENCWEPVPHPYLTSGADNSGT
ncbi:MAG: SpoIID/LytB domain-containing protein, partial [Muribaculaceae bacterium]|nr:SpoIID/LytB domain-containing protein [Muribaculaceae bacterium]